MEYEKSHGAPILVHSEGSIDAFPQNCPSSFTNILQKPLNLDNHEEFVVGVSNVHLPTKQYILLKNDIESSITYNVGMFIFDKAIDDWILMKNSNRMLFTYTPIKNIEPVLTDSDAERIFLLKKLSEVLKLRSNSDLDFERKSNLCHKLFQTLLYHHTDKFHGPKNGFKNCESCVQMVEKKFRYNSELYLSNIFDSFNKKNRNHVSLKTLNINDGDESRHIYEDIIKFLEIKPDEYLRAVITKDIRDEFTSQSLPDLLTYSWENDLYGPEHDITKPVFALYATFGTRMADFLNIHKDTKYFIHSDDLDMNTPSKKYIIKSDRYNPLITPRYITPKILSYFIYSDVVKHSVRLGDTVSNLLCVITVDESVVNMKNPISSFKPISHNTIYSISCVLTDQYGRRLHFVENQYAALDLIIKRRE